MDQLEHDIKTVRTIFVLLVALVAGISLYDKYQPYWIAILTMIISFATRNNNIFFTKVEIYEKTINN